MKSDRKVRNALILMLLFYGMNFLNACKSTSSVITAQPADTVQKEEVFLIGMIQKQGVTTYQYGTHVLTDKNGKMVYALKSETVQLDDYIGKTIELKGIRLNDYPIDGGPPYIEVISIKVKF